MTEYPTKSAHIRALAVQGMTTADIARTVGVRYQHARNVLLASSTSTLNGVRIAKPKAEKPRLSKRRLLESGFSLAGEWQADQDRLLFSGHLPKEAGVYAFCDQEDALYVGVATMGLAKRLYYYRRPGVTQNTSIRIREALLSHLATGRAEVLIATTERSAWNGLPVDVNAGLEVGLIKDFLIPWNKWGI